MTWTPDLSFGTMVIAGPCVRAIGWLDREHAFPVGTVPPAFVDALDAFRRLAPDSEDALGFDSFCGFHVCELCPDPDSIPEDGRRGWRNFAVPYANLLFVCPELITHYVGTHRYRPPNEFVAAVVESPLPGSEAYTAATAAILRRLERGADLARSAALAHSQEWIAKAMCPRCRGWTYEYPDGWRRRCACGVALVSRSENPSPAVPLRPRWLVVTGPAGAGKSTIGEALAERLRAAWCDADDLHPPANIAKMRRGEPLTDADREPWLAAVHDVLAAHVRDGESLVIACSALRAAHRRRLCAGLPAVELVYLRAPREVLAARLAARRDHFFAPELLDSQLAALEEPDDALVVDATDAPEAIVARIAAT